MSEAGTGGNERLAAEALAGITQRLAAALGERDEAPVKQLRQIVEKCGAQFADDVFAQAQEIEANGGLFTRRRQRRTLGGVFFAVARSRMSRKRAQKIFRWRTAQTAAPGAPRPEWADRMALLDTVRTEKGSVCTVKLTLVGRPGRVAKHRGFVMFAMTSDKMPSLPRGLPIPPRSTATTYHVYVSEKQWRPVEPSIANPADSLIVEGFPMLDPEGKAVAVFCLNVTTKLLRQAAREQRATAPAEEKEHQR